jgi:hypothetical protein
MVSFMPFCENCGSEVSQLKDYCSNCGAKVMGEKIITKVQDYQFQENQVQENQVQERFIGQPPRSEQRSDALNDIYQFRGGTTLSERLRAAYGKAFWLLLAMLGYAFLGVIVIIIGSVIAALFGLYELAILISILVGILMMFGAFAAFLFAASRGDYRTQLGFFEALTVSFKLVGELALVLVGAVIFFILGYAFIDTIGILFVIVGAIALYLFPIAAQFYLIDFIVERRKRI